MLPRQPFEKLRFLRESDPGLLRLTQACKTVLAVTIAICLYWHAGLQTRMFAAAGSAYIMQSTSTGPLRRREWTMIISGLAMAAVVGFSGALTGHRWLQDLLMVVVAALAYYFRRFLPDKSQFPIFGFILCVLAAVLSTGWRQGLHDMVAVVTAIPIAFGIYFFVFPPRIVHAARDQIRDFCTDAGRLLEAPWKRRRFEALASRPAFLKGIADMQQDHPAVPRIRSAAADEYSLLESLLIMGVSRSNLGFHPIRGAQITSSPESLLALPPREAAQLLAARAAAGRLDALQARLADAADTLGAWAEGPAT